MYARHMSSLNYFNLAGKQKFEKVGDFHMSLAMRFSSFTGNDFDGVTISDTGSQVKAAFFMGVLGYSRQFFDNWTIGINMKFHNENLNSSMNDFNFAVDLGSILDFGIINDKLKGFSYGLSFHNIGTKTVFNGIVSPTPFTFRSGLAYDWWINDKHKLLSSVDFEKVNDRGLKFNIGVAYTLFNMAIFRVGYKVGDALNGIKWGAGFHYQNFKLDYSFDFGDVGINNRVEIGFHLNPDKKEKGPNFETLYYMGVKAFNNDELDKAEKIFRLILKVNPNYDKADDRLQETLDLKKKRRRLNNFQRSMEGIE